MKKYNSPPNIRKLMQKPRIVYISSFENTNSEQSQIGIDCTIKDLLELLEDYFKSYEFASFLTAIDVISLSSVCKSFRKIFNRDYLQLVIKLGNLNNEIRYLFWIHQAPYARYILIQY